CMPPSIHPVDLIGALRHKHLTPAIVFLTSRRACDEAMQAFQRSHTTLPPERQHAITSVLDQLIAQYPSIDEHPLVPTVQRVGFAVGTPSPYIDLTVITKGLTGQPEPIDSQFVIAYPMVLNLLKAHPLEQIQAILARSFAQFQLNRRAETLEGKLDALHVHMEPYGPRVCTDWITQWQVFEQARKQKAHRIQVRHR